MEVREVEFFRGKLRFLQPDFHRISVDLVLFASRIKGVKGSSLVVDLGAGFGFLSLVIAKRWGCRVVAVERDERVFSLLVENIKLNGLEGLVEPIKEDIRYLKLKGADVAVSNPPFFPKDYSKRDGGFHFEEDTTLKDFIVSASRVLRDGGYANFLIPSFRLGEIFHYSREVNLHVRELTFMFPTQRKPAKLTIALLRRNLPGQVHVNPPLVINEESGGYTPAVEEVLENFLR